METNASSILYIEKLYVKGLKKVCLSFGLKIESVAQ